MLSAFKANPHITAAALYDKNGKLFATYPKDMAEDRFPPMPGGSGYRFGGDALIGLEPVAEGSRKLGALYVKSDLNAMYARIRLYLINRLLIAALSVPFVYVISRRLQRRLLRPIAALADTARAVSAPGGGDPTRPITRPPIRIISGA